MLAGTSPLAPLGARMKMGGSVVSILPQGIRALRRECVRDHARGFRLIAERVVDDDERYPCKIAQNPFANMAKAILHLLHAPAP